MKRDVEKFRELEEWLRAKQYPEWADEVGRLRRMMEEKSEEDWQRYLKEMAPAIALAKLLWDIVNYFIDNNQG